MGMGCTVQLFMSTSLQAHELSVRGASKILERGCHAVTLYEKNNLWAQSLDNDFIIRIAP